MRILDSSGHTHRPAEVGVDMKSATGSRKERGEARTWIYLIVVLQALFLLQMGDFLGIF